MASTCPWMPCLFLFSDLLVDWNRGNEEGTPPRSALLAFLSLFLPSYILLSFLFFSLFFSFLFVFSLCHRLQQFGLDALVPAAFQAYTRLEELELHDNNLTALPALPCPRLQRLNVANNDLAGVGAVRLPPSLRQLTLTDNPRLEPWASEVLALLHPTLMQLNDQPAGPLRARAAAAAASARTPALRAWDSVRGSPGAFRAAMAKLVQGASSDLDALMVE